MDKHINSHQRCIPLYILVLSSPTSPVKKAVALEMISDIIFRIYVRLLFLTGRKTHVRVIGQNRWSSCICLELIYFLSITYLQITTWICVSKFRSFFKVTIMYSWTHYTHSNMTYRTSAPHKGWASRSANNEQHSF